MASIATSKRGLIVTIVVIAVLALLFGVWSSHNTNNSANNNKPLVLENGTVFPHPRSISAFTLTDIEGQPFTKENLKGHWSLLFFGFTSCHAICPTTLSLLNKTYQQLQQIQQQPMPQIVLISVDPERDTPERMRQYLAGFNKNFLGATGSKEQIVQLTREMTILYMKVQKQGSEQQDEYDIDHSGTLLLMGPSGNLYALFSTPHHAEKLARDLHQIITQYQKKHQKRS